MPKPAHRRLRVLAVPAFKDNYLWLIHDGVFAIAVDPGDAGPIVAALNAHHLTLSAILLTHHHADHIGGVPQLLIRSAVPVFGPRAESIATVTDALAGGAELAFANPAVSFKVEDVPGHTRGHLAYVCTSLDTHWLFCGDTLFGAGCGRLFEGTAGQMQASLDKLAALPEDTQVFCAHEYTLANLRFAQAAEPANGAVTQRLEQETRKRAAGQPTIPSTIALEKATNPFLRYREPGIARHLAELGKIAPGAPPAAVFAALREWKNTF